MLLPLYHNKMNDHSFLLAFHAHHVLDGMEKNDAIVKLTSIQCL
ncbi:hypothetical protein GTCCBUS3UF5_16270 [Geobacillus thermoleovorans CCB_US3_UF5]|uniref:Uncharacterized protein n=1 Tax=Geobacillus thermoleovorans CCB_US3_UF5 TaxID=1111068 RepID=A0ABN3ZT83_GEOTH|nr:hypothetical protein GTCCBUS3UF5_16270 [Geobacillus thermoleovorans CCB_US3_UF5]